MLQCGHFEYVSSAVIDQTLSFKPSCESPIRPAFLLHLLLHPTALTPSSKPFSPQLPTNIPVDDLTTSFAGLYHTRHSLQHSKMTQQITNDQCQALCGQYIQGGWIPSTLMVILWIVFPFGASTILFLVGYGVRKLYKHIKKRGARIIQARKEGQARKEQEARSRAMRLSGLEVEMDNMGRSDAAKVKRNWEMV